MPQTPINANGFMFFVDLLICCLKQMEHGRSVTTFTCDLPKSQMNVQFEVRIKAMDGKRLPAVRSASPRAPT